VRHALFLLVASYLFQNACRQSFRKRFLLPGYLATFTPAIFLLELAIAYMMEGYGWKRRLACLVIGGATFAVAIFAPFSMGILGNFTIASMNIFDVLDYVSGNRLLPVSEPVTATFLACIWGGDKALKETTTNGAITFAWASL
jgi:NSS family neurotransmitter:Na+ symporter